MVFALQVRSDFIENNPNIPVLISPANEISTYYLQPVRIFQSVPLPTTAQTKEIAN
jgi:hypothetical protein